MKPYLLVAGDFVKTGGMDRANFALADYLAKTGREVNLLGYGAENELLLHENLKFYQVPKIANSYLLSSPWFNWSAVQLARRLSTKGCNVVVNGGNCQWGDINWVHYVHASYQSDSRLGQPYKIKGAISRGISLRTELLALKSARLIIANSELTKRDLIEKLQIPPEKIFRVYYGIDPKNFYPISEQQKNEIRKKLNWTVDKNIIIFIGALGDRRKGFDTLFEAWQKLNETNEWKDCSQLMVIGTGAELAQWQARTQEAKISNIEYLGRRKDVPLLLRAGDCLVAPSRYEAYGLGVREALCTGLPAIVSANAGVAEHYDQDLKDLLLSNPNDSNELCDRLLMWYKNESKYRELAFNLSNQLRSHTWDDMARDIIEKIEG